jgi:hypothetical protein
MGVGTVKRMLDLFCGRLGWSKAFLARGWECVGVDLIKPPQIPYGLTFFALNVLSIQNIDETFHPFDFICASSPCEEFSIHGMKHFHPNPEFPESGIRLFNHTRKICEASGVPYVMENVKPAQKFVGRAMQRCGPFALWGRGVPPLMPQGITKGFGAWDRQYILTTGSSTSKRRQQLKAQWATIPPELANCVADYAERLLEQKQETSTQHATT